MSAQCSAAAADSAAATAPSATAGWALGPCSCLKAAALQLRWSGSVLGSVGWPLPGFHLLRVSLPLQPLSDRSRSRMRGGQPPQVRCGTTAVPRGVARSFPCMPRPLGAPMSGHLFGAWAALLIAALARQSALHVWHRPACADAWPSSGASRPLLLSSPLPTEAVCIVWGCSPWRADRL